MVMRLCQVSRAYIVHSALPVPWALPLVGGEPRCQALRSFQKGQALSRSRHARPTLKSTLFVSHQGQKGQTRSSCHFSEMETELMHREVFPGVTQGLLTATSGPCCSLSPKASPARLVSLSCSWKEPCLASGPPCKCLPFEPGIISLAWAPSQESRVHFHGKPVISVWCVCIWQMLLIILRPFPSVLCCCRQAQRMRHQLPPVLGSALSGLQVVTGLRHMWLCPVLRPKIPRGEMFGSLLSP